METLHNSGQGKNSYDDVADSYPAATDPVQKEQHQRLFQRGLIWLGAGIFFMALSFGINFFLFQADHSFTTAMYVLTSLGAVLILKGLADILGF